MQNITPLKLQRMGRFLAIFLCFLSTFKVHAGPGDTLFHVQSHDKVHMNWYGNFDRWAEFPAAGSGPYYRVVMDYTLGCPSTGCSEWDYTTQVFLRHRTGLLDSNAIQHPFFTVNGNSPDSTGISFSPTFSTFWDSLNQEVDTTFYPQVQVVLFQNPGQPGQATDTLTGWPVWTWYPLFDANGQVIDSVWWAADSVVQQSFTTTYQVFEVVEEYELGRVITPFSGTFGTGWSWRWTYDVTDYQHLLKDSVEIRAKYSGWQDGFTVSLDFYFIEGSPPLEALQIKKMFGGSFAYGNPNQPINNRMRPLMHKPLAQAARTDALLHITGHGFGGNENCAEFCSKAYYLDVDQQQRASAQVWRDGCGWNPIFPQGGTWVYDRSNWCPGDKVDWYRHRLNSWLGTDSSEIRFRMQDFVNINNNNTSYITEGYVIDYAAPSYPVEASLESILAPSNTLPNSRYNPICGSPVIQVRNEGAQTLTELSFEYGVEGGPMYNHTWTGQLELLETETIELPPIGSWFNGFGQKKFVARIMQANQQTDALSFNNEKTSFFESVPQFPDSMVLFLKTNVRPNENSWELTDAQGQVVASASGFSPNAVLRDTLRLEPGCYRFRFLDSGGDGLSFWANPNAGSGLLRFERISTSGIQPLKIFQPDFGSGVDFSFTVGYEMQVDSEEKLHWTCYPVPTSHGLSIDLSMLAPGLYDLSLIDLQGRVLKAGSLNADLHHWDIRHLSAGVYLLQIQSPKGKRELRRVVKH